MIRHIANKILLGIGLVAVSACGAKSTQDHVDEYLAFYYPTTGEYFYIIDFEWGYYQIDTFPKPDEDVHPDSEPYRGFITMRPSADTDEEGKPLKIYLVTPEGEVWRRDRDDSIPPTSSRKEVTVDGSTTMTTTIESPGEPVIDDYRANPQAWSRYARLEPRGDEYELERIP